MEIITNQKDFKFKSLTNNSKPKYQSIHNKELYLNHSLHNNIKKLSSNQKYSKLKKKKTLDKFFEKYISEKLNITKDKEKNKKNNTAEKNIETRIFYNSSDKSGFYKRTKAKITKIIKNKKIITDSSFRINPNNFSECIRSQDKKSKKNTTSSPSNSTNLNLNKIKPHKRYPLKTINISELKSFEDNQENNITFLNHTNTNFYNNKNNSKIKYIKLLNNNLDIKNNCPMIWQIIAFTKKYKKLYENALKQNEELQKENEELKRKIENINDEVCILKEEDNLNKELIKENEDKMEELSDYIKQQNKINESRLNDFKYMLYKKDEEIQRLSKQLAKIDDSKRNIFLSLNNEILNFKEKINQQNEEINKYKEKIELFQNENIILKNINNNDKKNNITVINNFNNNINDEKNYIYEKQIDNKDVNI